MLTTMTDKTCFNTDLLALSSFIIHSQTFFDDFFQKIIKKYDVSYD